MQGIFGKYAHPHLPLVQHSPAHPQDVFALDRHVLVQAGVDHVGVTVEDVVVIQDVGPSAKATNAGKLAKVGAFHAISGPLQFLLRGWVLPDTGDLGVRGSLDFVEGVAGGGSNIDYELPRYFRRMVAYADTLGDLLFVNQRPVEAGALSICQDSPQELHSSFIRVVVGKRGPYYVKPGQRHPVAHFQLHPAGQTGIESADAAHRRTGRKVSEIPVNHFQSFVPPDVARDGQAGVGGGIEATEKVLYVIQAGSIQVFLGTNGHPVVGVGERKHGLLDIPLGHAVRAVLIALAPLVFYDVPLDLEPLLVQGVQQEPHAV